LCETEGILCDLTRSSSLYCYSLYIVFFFSYSHTILLSKNDFFAIAYMSLIEVRKILSAAY